jgi:predicted 2-oxoglutarate/Fe(II)-dependent dioxygenase YbiX
MMIEDLFFTEDECKKILEIKNKVVKYEGKNKYNLEGKGVYFNEYWLSNTQEDIDWITKKLIKFVEKHIGVKIKEINSDIAILEYNTGDKLGMHNDYNKSQEDFRVYTIGVILNTDWQGGDFIIIDSKTNEKKILQKIIGNTYLFDTLSPHMVDEITKGTRYTLITHIRNSEIIKKQMF